MQAGADIDIDNQPVRCAIRLKPRGRCRRLSSVWLHSAPSSPVSVSLGVSPPSPNTPEHAVTCTSSTLLRPTPSTLDVDPHAHHPPTATATAPSRVGLSCASVPSPDTPTPLQRPHRTTQAGRSTVRGRTSLACPALISQVKRQQAIEGFLEHIVDRSWPARGICTAPSGWERITPRALYPRFDTELFGQFTLDQSAQVASAARAQHANSHSLQRAPAPASGCPRSATLPGAYPRRRSSRVPSPLCSSLLHCPNSL